MNEQKPVQLVGAIMAPLGQPGEGLVVVPHPLDECAQCSHLTALALAQFAPGDREHLQPMCPGCLMDAMDDPDSGDVWYQSLDAWQADQPDPEETD